MRDPLHWLGVRVKLALLFVGVCLLAYGLGGSMVVFWSRNALESAILQGVEFQSQAFGQGLAAELELLRRRAEDFASDGYIRDHLERILRGGERGLEEELRSHLVRNKLPLEAAYRNLLVVDRQGRELVRAVPEDRPVAAEELARALQEAAGRDETWFSAFLPCREQGPVLLVATPLIDLRRERVLGQLVVLLRPGVVLVRSLRPEPEGPGLAAGRVLRLRDRRGQVLLVPPGYADPQGPRPEGEAVKEGLGLRLVPAAAAAGPTGGVLARTWPVERAGIQVEVQVPMDLALAPVRGLQARMVGVGVVLALLTGLLLFFPMRFLARPLQVLREAALRIRGGDFSVRVPVESEDEIGELAAAFNSMAEAVEQRTRQLEDVAADLRRGRNALRRERDRLHAVLRSMRDGLVVLDGAGRVALHNQAARLFLEALEERREELTGRHRCADRGDRRTQDCVACLFDPMGAARSCIVDLAGRSYEIHSTAISPVQGGEGGRVLAIRDITDRVTQDEQQIHQERLAVLGEVAAVMAHELNNPLTSIRMFAQMLAEELADEDGLAEHVQVITRNADTCRRTVRDLLEYATGAAPELGEVELHEVLDEVSRFLRPLAERRRVRIFLEQGVADARLRGDEVQLRQVFANLILNAIQAMPEGGTVRVRSGEAEGMLVVDILDDGPGIPEECREEIFRPFFTTKPRGEGTGLGLPTARRIAELHGGGLDLVRSGKGGSWFRVRLRRAVAVVEEA